MINQEIPDKPPDAIAFVTVDRVSSLGDISEHVWNEVADPRDLFQSRAWLCALERYGDAPVTYLIARRAGDSRILGALPLYDSPPSRGDYLTWPELHFRDLLATAPRGGRLGLLAGSCAGFGTRLILDRTLPGPARTAVLRALRDAAGVVAAERGHPYTFFLFLDAAAWRELAQVTGDGDHHRLAGVARTEVELPGAGFADYLATLPRNTRTSVRREAGLFARECATELLPLREAIPAVAPMIVNVRARHGMAYSVEVVARRLSAYAGALGEDSTALLCRAGGRVVGAGVMCRWHDRLHVTDFGRLDDGAPDPFVYFNAAIYEPIRHAYAAGLSRVVTGAGAELGKARRGAAVLPLVHLAWSATDGPDRPPGDQPVSDRPLGDLQVGDRPRGDRPGGERPVGGTPAEDRKTYWRRLRSAHPTYFPPVWDELL
ncbi:peptidogalycan biosysnthesis protein [Nonomuraea sp. NPDC050790]|uniref:peptidogalycan biosysnthesis protein n=1 Tax=Nonomuraea sp. NPDC050790 TaxID=3364371 RepID=UPI00378DF599